MKFVILKAQYGEVVAMQLLKRDVNTGVWISGIYPLESTDNTLESGKTEQKLQQFKKVNIS